jgi:putative redox protein
MRRQTIALTEERTVESEIAVHHLGLDRFAIDIRGHRLVVDQPSDESHREEGPTSTELFVAALASCAAHFAHRVLVRDDPHATVGVRCGYRMTNDAPHRVELVDLNVTLPPRLSAQRRASVERAMQHCTVHESLRFPPRIEISLAPDAEAVVPLAAAVPTHA